MGLFCCGILRRPFQVTGSLSVRVSAEKPEPFVVPNQSVQLCAQGGENHGDLYEAKWPFQGTAGMRYNNTTGRYEELPGKEITTTPKEWKEFLLLKDGKTKLWVNLEKKDWILNPPQQFEEADASYRKAFFTPDDHGGAVWLSIYPTPKMPTGLCRQKNAEGGYDQKPYLSFDYFEAHTKGRVVLMSTASTSYSGNTQPKKNTVMRELGLEPVLGFRNSIMGSVVSLWMKDNTNA